MTDTLTKEDVAKWMASFDSPETLNSAIRGARMLSAQQVDPQVFEPPIRTLGKYLDDDIEVPPELVYPYIVVRGGMGCTIGRAGKGKTVMNLNRMLRWSAGLPMFDDWTDKEGKDLLAPSQPLKALIVENEGAGGLFHRQIGIMLNAEGYLTADARAQAKENVLIWGDGGYSGLKLDDPEKLNLLRAGCEKWEPDIVFIEPFRGLWNGEENSSTDMAQVADALVEIASDYNCGVMISHHERKSGVGDDGEKMSAGRGSTVLEGVVTIMENFESAKGGEQRELLWSKSRHGKAPNPVRMEWDPDAWWYKHVPDGEIPDGIVTSLRGNADEPMTLKQLSEELDEPVTKLRKPMEQLVKDGKVKKMPGESNGQGSTGNRFRLPMGDGNSFGGLSV